MSLIIYYTKKFCKNQVKKLCVKSELKTYFIYANMTISLYATDLSLLGPLSISFSFSLNTELYLKLIFLLFIALLRHWGPHAISINNKI